MDIRISFAVFLSLMIALASCERKNQTHKTKLLLPEEAIAIAQKDPSVFNLMEAGLALSRAQRHQEAISYYERILLSTPREFVALNNMCFENKNLGRWDKAIEFCEASLSISPDFELAKNNLKAARDGKAAQLKLVEDLKAKATASKGQDRHGLLVNLGLEYYKMGEYDQAISTWKSVPKSKDPMYVRALNNLGTVYINIKNFDLAKEALEQAAKLDPSDQLIKNNLDWLKREVASVKK